jgi:hypothetical protein
LPVVYSGYAHNAYIKEDKTVFKTYSLENFREEMVINIRRSKGEGLPFDIYLKSTNDLVQSIISSLRANLYYNYIFCEGTSDYIYLKYYFSEYIENNRLRILPLGGFGEISRLMKNISVSLDYKENEIKGKILAIIDTDEQYNKVEGFMEKGNIYFKRITFNGNDIELISITSKERTGPIQIEDVLNPRAFKETLKNSIDGPLSKFDESLYNSNALCSYNAYDYRNSDRKALKEFFSQDGVKVKFAKEYIKNAELYNVVPNLFIEIIDVLGLNIKIENNILANNSKKATIIVPKRK